MPREARDADHLEIKSLLSASGRETSVTIDPLQRQIKDRSRSRESPFPLPQTQIMSGMISDQESVEEESKRCKLCAARLVTQGFSGSRAVNHKVLFLSFPWDSGHNYNFF